MCILGLRMGLPFFQCESLLVALERKPKGHQLFWRSINEEKIITPGTGRVLGLPWQKSCGGFNNPVGLFSEVCFGFPLEVGEREASFFHGLEGKELNSRHMFLSKWQLPRNLGMTFPSNKSSSQWNQIAHAVCLGFGR